MQTRSSSILVSNPSSNPTLSTNPNLKGRNRRCSKQRIEEFDLEELSPSIVMMADQRTMAQLLQAPTEFDNHEPRQSLPSVEEYPKPGLKHAKPVPKHTKLVTNGLGKEDLKGITTRSGVAYNGPTIPTSSKVVKQGTEVPKDQVQTPSPQSTAHVQPPVTQSKTPVSEQIAAPVSTPMPNLKSSIPYPSRRDNERRHEQANEQIEKFYEIFKDMSFKISFTDALILMPKFASTLKPLIGNKEKLSEMARTLMNEHCSTVILNKLPTKLGDPDKFLIPCEFPKMNECLVLADLGASINLMPLPVWKELALPELTPTYMTLELADHSVSKPISIAKDVSVKVGMFHFPADFVVIDFEPDPRVPLIPGSPTPSDDLIVSTTFPTLTPFVDSDFLLFEEANAFLGLEDDPDSPELDPSYYDPEGDIQMLEAILNSDPAPSFPDHEQSVPSFTNELKACEAKTIKSSVDEPPEVVEKEPKAKKDTVSPPNNESTEDVQPSVVQTETPVIQISKSVISSVSALKPNPKSSIPYPSRRNDERNPLIGNKEKLSEMARTLLNENCSEVLLKKLPEKLEDPGKFLTPCNFLGMDECLAVADLGASINLMPLSVWKRLSLPQLTSTSRIWMEKEPPRSIVTWDDLVSKFIHQFFSPYKTTNLHNEITNFQQRFDESFSEAWDKFKYLLKAYPHHGFSELHQPDTFYNALNSKDQDSLNSTVGVSMNTSTFGISPDVAELKDMVKALLLDKKSQNQAPA
nr:reverse transcriptase domain-containing protein [Tanacetum cinerariifolium]